MGNNNEHDFNFVNGQLGDDMKRLHEALSVIAIILIFMIAGTIDAEAAQTQQITQGE